MRDPARIKRITHLIEILWTQNPDHRLGQLLFNNVWASMSISGNSFYVEDDYTERSLIQAIKITHDEKGNPLPDLTAPPHLDRTFDGETDDELILMDDEEWQRFVRETGDS